jgi:site-specific DNA-methyltransferase (adenine-specific)
MSKSETFNMDCMEYLQSCEDNRFSIAIIDPPFGNDVINAPDWDRKITGRFGANFKKYWKDLSVANNSVKVNHASGGKLFGKYDGDSDAAHWDVAPPDEFWKEIFRVCKWHIVWGGNYFWLPPSRNFIIWKKHIPENFSMAMIEYAWTDIPGNAKIVTYSPQDKFRFHPTQKPVALYAKLYEWYGDYCKGGVLDTFLGSGSNRIAAYDAGYDFVGIELNKVYFEKEKTRFSEHIARGDMFVSAGLEIVESSEGLF